MSSFSGKMRLPLRIPAYLLLFILLSVFITEGCQKEENTSPSNNYLVSFTKVNNYSASFIKLLLGTMSAAYPGIDTLISDCKYGIDLYSITYHTKYKGAQITASGLVAVPASSDDFPILSFQNGTNTYKFNAPTVNPSDPMYTLMEMMASHGYVVVIADYLGFGSSSDMLHPYYDKASSNSAVLDMIKAAHELLNDDAVKAGSNGKHFLMGYSQGGWATLCALQATEAGNDSISVTATSCGAGAYDLTAMSDYVLQQEVFPGPLYLPYFIYSRIRSGEITEPLTTYFNEPYASNIPELFNGNHANTQVNEGLNDTIAALLTQDMILHLSSGNNFASLRAAMTNNSIQAWRTNSLLRFYHGTDDLNVPPVQSELIFNQFNELILSNTQVTLIPIPGVTHETGLIPWGVNTIMWFDSLNP